MHKNWVIKGYDQSVTCLANDPQNLGTHSSTLRTLGVLSQTNNSIHKQSIIDARVNSNKKIESKNATEEIRFAKKIKSNGATKLKLRKKQDPFTNLD